MSFSLILRAAVRQLAQAQLQLDFVDCSETTFCAAVEPALGRHDEAESEFLASRGFQGWIWGERAGTATTGAISEQIVVQKRGKDGKDEEKEEESDVVASRIVRRARTAQKSPIG